MLATSSPAPGSIPGGDRVFRALTDHTVPSDQDLNNAGPVLCLALSPWLKHARKKHPLCLFVSVAVCGGHGYKDKVL